MAETFFKDIRGETGAGLDALKDTPLKNAFFTLMLPGGKNPNKKNWQKNPLTLDEAIQKRAPRENIGVICGFNGLIVVDIDSKGDGYAKLLNDFEKKFPHTLQVQTAHGGRHFYFKSRQILDFAQKGVFNLANGCGELRVSSCCVCCPPSQLTDGGVYRFLNNNPILEVSRQDLFSILPFAKNEENPQTGKKVSETIQEILNDSNPSEQQRVSLAMRLFEKYRWTALEISSYIAQNNKWSDFDESFTLKKVQGVLKSYAYRPNPNTQKGLEQAPASDVKTLELKDPTFLFNLKENKDFLIQDFLYPGSLVMFYSPPGEFKSLLSLYAGVCIATGKTFLGMNVKKKRVLLCDKENNAQILRDRMIKIRKGIKLHRKKFPLYFLLREGNLDDPGFVLSLKKTVIEKKIDLVFFDTLHRFSNYEENSADDISRIYTTVFQPLIDETGASVVFLHHSSKAPGNQYRGSVDFLGMTDTAFSIIREKYGGVKNGKFSIVNEKGRSGEKDCVRGEINFEEDYISITERTGEETRETLNLKKMVTTEIRTLFPMVGTQKRTSEIQDHFAITWTGDHEARPKVSPATVKRCLAYLVNNNELDSGEGKKRGVYTRKFLGMED